MRENIKDVLQEELDFNNHDIEKSESPNSFPSSLRQSMTDYNKQGVCEIMEQFMKNLDNRSYDGDEDEIREGSVV